MIRLLFLRILLLLQMRPLILRLRLRSIPRRRMHRLRILRCLLFLRLWW